MPVKLIRDKIPQIAVMRDQFISVHVAARGEMVGLLTAKLQEEADEVLASVDDPGALLEELADVIEVVQALGAKFGWTPKDIEEARALKHKERGGFDRRFVLTTTGEAK